MFAKATGSWAVPSSTAIRKRLTTPAVPSSGPWVSAKLNVPAPFCGTFAGLEGTAADPAGALGAALTCGTSASGRRGALARLADAEVLSQWYRQAP